MIVRLNSIRNTDPLSQKLYAVYGQAGSIASSGSQSGSSLGI